jgi:hypothetical protein
VQTGVSIAIAAAVLGCSSPAADPAPPRVPPASIDAGIDAAPVIDAGPPLGEVDARAYLGDRFRAAGLRVRYDVRVEGDGYGLTVDGYDPERRIGFEYIAPDEVDTDVSPAERARMAADQRERILLVGPLDRTALHAATDAFLQMLPADP